MESSNQFLGTERISKLMQKYAIPCIISLLVGALYNIVDQIFIANASYLGSYGNAANTVVFPLTVVALAIAVMIGDGCCAFVSISLGQSEVSKARRSVGNAVVMCLVSSIVLAALYLVFADNILAMFGGTVNAETYHHSQEYFFYITLGAPFYMFGQAMNPIIRADGNPRFAMISTLAGAVLNIILDPVFIFGLRWGMMGAAVATVIGQLVTAALAVWYLLHMKIIRPEKGDYRLKGSICGRTLTLGMTSFLSQISLVAAMAAINNMIRKYGALDTVFGQEQYAQIPMAVVGIVMKFFQPHDHFVQNLNPFLVPYKGAFHCFPLFLLFGFAGICQAVCNRFPIHQGGSGTFPDFPQHMAVKGIIINPVLGAVVLPKGIVGLAGVNPLGMFGVCAAYRQ